MTKNELISKLRDEEETLLIDLLNLTSTEIVDAFLDRIDERYEYLYGQYEEDEEQN
jgi:ribosome assembly protein YihI (activator of Der GTPase)